MPANNTLNDRRRPTLTTLPTMQRYDSAKWRCVQSLTRRLNVPTGRILEEETTSGQTGPPKEEVLEQNGALSVALLDRGFRPRGKTKVTLLLVPVVEFLMAADLTEYPTREFP